MHIVFLFRFKKYQIVIGLYQTGKKGQLACASNQDMVLNETCLQVVILL